MRINPGAVDQTVYFRLRDSSTGLPRTGLAYNSAGAQISYTRNRAAAASITPATLASASAAHSDGGFVEIDSTKCPGLYRLDLPDAAVASGVAQVVVSVTFTGVIGESMRIALEQAPAGAGSIAFTFTVNNSVTSLPISGANVWVSTDSAGSNVVAAGFTNAAGQVVFYLDAGTYYAWVQEEGYSGTNPTTITVS
jgi:hypothetical protein